MIGSGSERTSTSKWSEVKWGRETFAIKKTDYQEERILEMIFLDVGQGDGCILTIPQIGSKEKILILSMRGLETI